MRGMTRSCIDRLVPAIAVASFFVAGSRSAGQTVSDPDPFPWSVTAFGGVSFGANPYTLEGAQKTDVRFKETSTYGLRLGRDIGSRFGIEIAWTHAEPVLASTVTPPGILGRRRVNSLELGLNRSIPLGFAVGLLEFGIGGRGSRDSLGGTNLTANLGAAISVSVLRRLALRLDGRFRETYGNLALGDEFAYCDATGCYAYRHRWFGNWDTVGGLTYSF